jgi:hypothetical protein
LSRKEKPMKETKWVKHKLSDNEKKAQAIWRRAEKERGELVDALKSCDYFMGREGMHKRLDRRLDAIERSKARAAEMFPEVEESFTMFTGTITL